jgi:hypothetical protein
MKDFTSKLLIAALLTFPLITQAVNLDQSENANFIIKVTSKYPQPIHGSYLADYKLVMVNTQTPFVRKLNAKYVQLMMATEQSNPAITVELLMENTKYSGKPGDLKWLSSSGTGHTTYDCLQSRTSLDKVSICHGVNYAG